MINSDGPVATRHHPVAWRGSPVAVKPRRHHRAADRVARHGASL